MKRERREKEGEEYTESVVELLHVRLVLGRGDKASKVLVCQILQEHLLGTIKLYKTITYPSQ